MNMDLDHHPKNELKLWIIYNESKSHKKMLVTHIKSNGIRIYPGGGKKPCDRKENGCPPSSHDCMLEETEFADYKSSKQTAVHGNHVLHY